MKIGLFGGTFDPIHLGHMDMMQKLLDDHWIDKAILIPSFIPPHKDVARVAPYKHRLEMAQLATAGDARFEVSAFESESDKPSYTFYTVAYFNKIYTNDELCYVMGVDAFNEIQTWYRWKSLICMTNLIVVARPQNVLHVSAEVKKVLDQSPKRFIHLPLKTLAISSTIIRQALEEGQSAKKFLTEEVAGYIRDNHLYEW